MSTVNLGQVIDRARARGDYQNSDVFTRPIMVDFANEALSEVHDLLVNLRAEEMAVMSNLSAYQASQTVTLPSDFYKLVDLRVNVSGRWRKLNSMTIGQMYSLTDGAAYGPYRYRLQGGELLLAPLPATNMELRMYYVQTAPKLVNDTDTWESGNRYERLWIERVLLLCDQREERPLNERMARIVQMETDIRQSSDARDVEPYYLRDRDDDDSDWGLF
jgi:hypothetical protein